MLKNSFDAFANNQYVLVYYDVSYYYCIAALKESLENHRIFPFIIWTQIDTCHNIDNGKDRSLYNHFHGRYYTLPGGVLLDDVSVFFIGPSSLLLTHITMYHTRSGRILYIDPSIDKEAKEAVLANKHFMRRYALVQKAKDANVIGIVIGTLGVGKCDSFLHMTYDEKVYIFRKSRQISLEKPKGSWCTKTFLMLFIIFKI
jgi:diphthamide biosynthesis protein 2